MMLTQQVETDNKSSCDDIRTWRVVTVGRRVRLEFTKHGHGEHCHVVEVCASHAEMIAEELNKAVAKLLEIEEGS